MKMRVLLVVFLSLLFSGCASVTYQRMEGAADKKINDIAQASAAVKPVGILKPVTLTKLVITEKASPVFAQGEVESRFEVLQLTGQKDHRFRIDIMAMCDCLGFSKRSMAPVTYLLDSTGAAITKEVAEMPPESEWYKMRKTLQGKFPADGTYYLAIVADYHGGRDVRVGDAIGYIGGVEAFRKTIYQYPTGSALVKWFEPKEAAK